MDQLIQGHPLGKIALDAGISPVLWSFLISFSAASALLPFLAIGKKLHVPIGHVLRYVIISGMVTFVAVNLLVFTLIPLVGSGFIALMFALSPVFTLTISLLFKLKAPNLLGVIGIVFGFLGAGTVAFSHQSGEHNIQMIWVLLAISIPLILAIGNVYRTLDWPKGYSPDGLAFWSHTVAVLALFIFLISVNGPEVFQQLFRLPFVALMQAGVAALTFPVYFRLQQYGGPVLLSQIGYVGAAVGLLTATLFLGETYGLATWVGAGVIAIGIAITVLAQRTKK